MREIALDTETTGLSPRGGDRIVEIGCVELINHMATGEVYHQYINPQRDMPDGAFRVHGLSEEFLSDFPLFGDVAQAFLDFIGDSPLVIHNASFDMGFLNAELERAKMATLPMENTIDTVKLARKRFPGAQANLDALCRRFGIDNSNREKHGALLDAELLADVYLEFSGGRQPGLELAADAKVALKTTTSIRKERPPRDHAASDEELAAHAEFVKSLKDPIWPTD